MSGSTRIWGCNDDGTPYVVGMTVAELRKELERFPDGTEICMNVRQNVQEGRAMTGKLKSVGPGATGQLWLTAFVLDPSQE